MVIKPEFKLKVRRKLVVTGKPNSKAEAVVQRKAISQKQSQIENEVKWCKEHSK